MKYGQMSYSRSRNFGDQIQSLAAKQFLPKVDEYLDRDFLTKYVSNEEIKLIMNGWFMAEPQNWPPPKNIKPLLISFHISHDYGANQKLFTKEAIAFYKKNEPVGCRDYYTLELFQSKGIDAYYSGCLTLTLKNKYSSLAKSDDIYIMDVLYKIGGRSHDWLGRKKRNWIIQQVIPKNILKGAIKLTQDAPKNSSEEEKIALAESTLKKYATAKLVITSRIHCALPCIALNTPVIFIDGGLGEATDTTRLKGITEYFNSYSIDRVSKQYKGFIYELFRKRTFENPLNINWDNIPENPQAHLAVVEKLRKTCSNFISQT